MTFTAAILSEFDLEIANTRKLLQRVPRDLLLWKAGPTFNTIGWNAAHLAEIPGWVVGTLRESSWNMAPDGEPIQTPLFETPEEILQEFDANVVAARAALATLDESTLDQDWSLKFGDETLFTLPRRQVLRLFILNHLIHHRAHLCVYLRLNAVVTPGMYGPSADE